MGSRRTLITIAAVAVGAIAVFLIYGYVGSVKDEAFAEAERVKVYVVKGGVARGTYGEEAQSQKLIVESEIPKKFFPDNAIRNFDDIAGKVAVGDLAVNQIVTNDMFAEPGLVQSSFADRLERINDTDQVAITIALDPTRSVAGVLQPGDFVNILANCVASGGAGEAVDGNTPAADPAAPASTTEACEPDAVFGQPARTVFQKVQILAVGQTPVALPGEASTASDDAAAAPAEAEDAGLITFLVPAEASQYLASLSPEQIYLTLVARDYKPVPQTPFNRDELPGETAGKLTPYGPNGPAGE